MMYDVASLRNLSPNTPLQHSHDSSKKNSPQQAQHEHAHAQAVGMMYDV